MHVEKAWRLIEFLYLTPPSAPATNTAIATGANAGIVPPLPERWNEPQWHQPDPYFGGQAVGELYVQLAGQIPPRYVTPTTTIAEAEVSVVLSKAVAYIERRGPAGLDGYCQPLLRLADRDLSQRVAQEKFD